MIINDTDRSRWIVLYFPQHNIILTHRYIASVHPLLFLLKQSAF